MTIHTRVTIRCDAVECPWGLWIPPEHQMQPHQYALQVGWTVTADKQFCRDHGSLVTS